MSLKKRVGIRWLIKKGSWEWGYEGVEADRIWSSLVLSMSTREGSTGILLVCGLREGLGPGPSNVSHHSPHIHTLPEEPTN